MSDDGAAALPQTPQATSGASTQIEPAQIEPWLREILRCPSCRAELRDASGPSGAELVCTNPDCGLAYRVDDGIPVMLIDEARPTNQAPKA